MQEGAMVLILILLVGGLLLWLLFHDSERKETEKRVVRAREYQEAKDNYEIAKREARDAFRKQAEEKYRALGLEELLPHMVVMDSEVPGEVMLKWVGLSDEQERLLLKTIYEDERSELVDRVADEVTKSGDTYINNGDINVFEGDVYIQNYNE